MAGGSRVSGVGPSTRPRTSDLAAKLSPSLQIRLRFAASIGAPLSLAIWRALDRSVFRDPTSGDPASRDPVSGDPARPSGRGAPALSGDPEHCDCSAYADARCGCLRGADLACEPRSAVLAASRMCAAAGRVVVPGFGEARGCRLLAGGAL